MADFSRPKPDASFWALCASLSLLIALNSRGILNAYSFWLDELASVFLIGSVDGLWAGLMDDNFPPLYFLLLKGWSAIFGVNEVSLRLPSLLFVSAAFIVLGAFVYRYLEKGIWPILSVALVGTLPTVVFSAQEVRPYGLLLFFSTLAITNALTILKAPGQRNVLFCPATYSGALICLSLTHYFGLIVALLIAGVGLFYMSMPMTVVNAVLIPVFTVWPSIHASSGRLLSQTGGNFWIKVFPIIGSLKVLIVTCPFLTLLLVLFSLLLLRKAKQSGPDVRYPRNPPLDYLICIFLGFVGLMLVLDLHTPLSIPRYYVPIIPVAALLTVEFSRDLLCGVKTVPWKLLFCLSAALLVFCQAVKAEHRLALKAAPDQNWKQLAAMLRSTGLCEKGCDSVGYTKWGDYYFSGIPLSPLSWQREHRPSDVMLDRPLLGFHRASGVIPGLMSANPKALCLEPQQSNPLSIFVVIPQRLQHFVGMGSGLFPCRIS